MDGLAIFLLHGRRYSDLRRKLRSNRFPAKPDSSLSELETYAMKDMIGKEGYENMTIASPFYVMIYGSQT